LARPPPVVPRYHSLHSFNPHSFFNDLYLPFSLRIIYDLLLPLLTSLPRFIVWSTHPRASRIVFFYVLTFLSLARLHLQLTRVAHSLCYVLFPPPIPLPPPTISKPTDTNCRLRHAYTYIFPTIYFIILALFCVFSYYYYSSLDWVCP